MAATIHLSVELAGSFSPSSSCVWDHQWLGYSQGIVDKQNSSHGFMISRKKLIEILHSQDRVFLSTLKG